MRERGHSQDRKVLVVDDIGLSLLSKDQLCLLDDGEDPRFASLVAIGSNPEADFGLGWVCVVVGCQLEYLHRRCALDLAKQ